MRLIDADSIKFTEYVNGDITVSKEEIDKIPTAYDVNKVVEKLESMKLVNNSGWDNLFVDVHNDVVGQCIEVVKKGGI